MSVHGIISRIASRFGLGGRAPLRAPARVTGGRAGSAAAGRPFEPQRAPAPIRDIAAQPYYSDPANSTVDPVLFARNRAIVDPLNDYVDRVSAMADRWLGAAAPDPRVPRTALAWLDAWARADALLGRVTMQGAFHRKWALCGLALAWLDLRDAADLDPAAVRRVADWLAALGASVKPPYDAAGADAVRNNHVCWAALAAASAAIVGDDAALLRWGLDRARTGLAQIADDGTMPLEMERQSKALHYHLFAVSPLVITAEIAAANHADLWRDRDGALRRLAERALGGVEDPSWFAARAGSAQDFVGGALTGRHLAWVEPYFARFPDARRPALLAGIRPLVHPWLGGDLTLRYGTD